MRNAEKEENDFLEEIKKDIIATKNDNIQIRRLLEVAQYWIECGATYIMSSTNKLDDVILCFEKNKSIYLVNVSYSTIMYAPKIMFRYKSNNHLHIDDILMKTNNIGNGSIAMTALIKYAKLNNVDIITGDLSTIDSDHKERRDHYYDKFDFENHGTYVIKYLGKR